MNKTLNTDGNPATKDFYQQYLNQRGICSSTEIGSQVSFLILDLDRILFDNNSKSSIEYIRAIRKF